MSNELMQTGFFDLEEVTGEKAVRPVFDRNAVITRIKQRVQEDNDLEREQEDNERRHHEILSRRFEIRVEIGIDLLSLQADHANKNKNVGTFTTSDIPEIGISRNKAYDCMNVAKLILHNDFPENAFSGKSYPWEVWRELARPSTNETVITQVIDGTIEATPKSIKEAQKKIEELEETNQELQGKLNLFEEEREEAKSQIKALETKIESLEDKALIHEQAKTIIEQKMQANNAELERLKEELEKKSEPVEKFVVPPETEKEIEDLKESIAKLAQDQIGLQKKQDENEENLKDITSQRDRLLEKNQELLDQKEKQDEEATKLAAQLKRKGEVKLRLSQYCDAIRMRTSQASVRAISPNDAQQYFDPEDWNTLAQAEQDLRRLADECARLRESFTRQFVDAAPVVESPIAYIGANNYA